MISRFETEDKGYGVQADQTIPKHAFIIDFIGEILTENEFRMKETRGRGIYTMELTEALYIDPKKKGNLARFINRSCAPNARAELWQVKGKLHIVIRASKKIKQGKEITIHYGSECDLGTCMCLICKERELSK